MNRYNDFPVVIETFRNLGHYELSGLDQKEPSCFNGDVRIRRYRVTVEEIPEPLDVLRARLLKLWEESDNMHNWDVLQAEAKRIGFALDSKQWGTKRKSPTP